MRPFKLLTLLSLLLLGTTHLNAQEYITWSADRKLTWADFKGSPPANTKLKAGFSYDILLDLNTDTLPVVANVTAIVYPPTSWVFDSTDNQLLEHEQGHFDMAELRARRMRQKFKKYMETHPTITGNRLGKKLWAIYNAEMSTGRYLQKRYERLTDHGKNTEYQHLWLEDIAAWLEELKDYAYVSRMPTAN